VVAGNANDAVMWPGGACVWQESGFSRRKGSIFNAISKSNAAVIFICCSTQKFSFPSTSTGRVVRWFVCKQTSAVTESCEK
jgi:hypothetical protein